MVYFVDKTTFMNPLTLDFVLITILTVIVTVFLMYSLKKMPSIYIDIPKKSNWFQSIHVLSGLRHMLSTIDIKFISISYFLFQFASGLLFQGISLYLAAQCAYTSTQISIFMFIMSLIMLVGVYLLPKIISKFFDFNIQYVLSLLVIVMIVLFGIHVFFPKSLINGFFRIWFVSGVFYMIQPSIEIIFTSLLTDNTSTSKRAMVMGGSGQMLVAAWSLSAVIVGMMLRHKMVLALSCFSLIISLLILIFYTKRTVHSDD